jgi:A/G-specific adenine glycosylase
MDVSQKIVDWYTINKRNLPWRDTKDPYKIWVSEIVLQQTRVEQGLNYYLRFIDRFPSVESLASANEDEVLKYWQGLGYYSRARNLHFSAKYIVESLNGKFPNTFAELKKLKGVGDYTAAAIASFAYNEKVPLVDGNVYRVLSRLLAEGTPIDTSNGKKLFSELANELLSKQEAQVFNQAIMEFGALQCKPSAPDCDQCPIQTNCLSFAEKKIAAYPVKSKKVKVRKRFLNYLFIADGENTFLKKRNSNDIWKGLFEFPLIETKSKVSLKTLSKTKEWVNLFNNLEVTVIEESEAIKHQLSHQQLIVLFFKLKINGAIEKNNRLSEFQCTPILTINKYAVPKVIENYLKEVL